MDKLLELFDNAPSEVFDQITSTRRNVREKALALLIKPLDIKESEIDFSLFQVIPLEFLGRGDILGAIWFIETTGKHGITIAWEVVEKVLSTALEERTDCILRGDDDGIREISRGLDSFFRIAKVHEVYKDRPELYILMGKLKELKNTPDGAILCYKISAQLGSAEGYIAAAAVYEKLGKPVKSLAVLEEGWAQCSDARILSEIIFVLAKLKRTDEAAEQYYELKRIYKGNIIPFLFYKGVIENDDEVKEVEKMIATYISEGSFTPHEPFKFLLSSCSEYITSSLQSENVLLEKLDHQPQDTWSKEDYTRYTDRVHRRLWLMQTDILSLGDERYIPYYLSELRKLGIEGTQNTKYILQDFFTEHFSEEVRQDIDERNSIHKNPQFRTLLTDMSLHIMRISEIYFQGSFYELHENLLIPFLRDCAKSEGKYDDEMENNFFKGLQILKQESDYYTGLRSKVRESYEKYTREIDEKYGVCYKKRIQLLARGPSLTGEKFLDVLKTYHDISFLFWCEKLITGRATMCTSKEFDEIVSTYSLDIISKENALLFGTLLGDLAPDYAIEFIAGYPGMLHMPEAIYLITDLLKYMDQDTQKSIKEDLFIIAKEQYDTRGFFEQIRLTFANIGNTNPDRENQEYMFLANGNKNILQKKKDKNISLIHFHEAIELGSLEGLIGAGDLFVKNKQYNQALPYFEKAFCQNDTKTILEKILNCTLLAGRFEVAEQYINLAIQKKMSIENYIIAFHLFQGKIRPAFTQAIASIQSGAGIIDMPEGLIRLLFETLSSVSKMDDTHIGEEEEWKILGSFISMNISTETMPMEPEMFLSHLEYIISLCNCYEGEMLHEKIQRSLGPILPDVETDHTLSATSDISVQYLQKHGSKLCRTLQIMFNKAHQEKDTQRARKIFGMINLFCENMIILLQRFPDTEKHVLGWRNGLNFLPNNSRVEKMPHLLQ